MPAQLNSFIERAMATADKRNLAPENPITLLIDVGGSDLFYVAVAHSEPNHVTLPLNVTWIVADPDSPNYRKALRRASALPFDSYRNTWAELRTYQDFLDELQFWDLSATFQMGEVQITGVREATTTARGLFQLNREFEDETNPIVVGDNDIRMSNARQPLPHTHPLLPATMLAGSTGINQFYVDIVDGRSPVSGEILMLTGEGDAEGEWMGYWRRPVAADITYNGPTFDMLEIVGTPNGTVDETVPVPFRAIAHFSDGTSLNSVAAEWTIIANQSAGTISTSTGVFTSANVVGDQVVRIQARWTHPASGQQRTSTYDLTVVDTTFTATLVRIEISGPSTIDEGNRTAAYTITAHYDDLSSRGVTPATFTSSNPGAGTLSMATGVFTSSLNVSNNQLTTLTATYTENGITRSASLDLTVIDRTIYPQSAVIQGSASVAENTTEQYVLVVTFTDLSTSEVVVSDWAIDNSAAGTIDASTGLFTAPTNVDEDVQAVISASFSSNGRLVTAHRNITVTDETIYPVSAVVIGSTQVNEGDSSIYRLRVTFSDETTADVEVGNWTSSNTTVGVINATTGEFTANQLTSNGVTDLSASYTQSGVTVGNTLEVTVIDRTNYPVSATIVGNANMNEGTQQNMILRVTYQDSTTRDVTASSWSSSNTDAATINSSGNVVAAVNLRSNATTTISAAYSEHGVQLNPTMLLTVRDITVYPVSARIVGPATVNEGTTVAYQLEVTFDNNSVQNVAVNTFTLNNPAAGTLTTAGSLTAPADVTSNISAIIAASYSLDGRVVNATLPITVTDDTVYPASARILGPASVNEDTTQTYTLEVTFTDATTQIVAVNDWNSSNTAAATITPSGGVLTALTVSADETTTIQASYTSAGTTVSDTRIITIVDTTNYPVSAEVLGAVSVNEGANVTYTLEVTFKDGSKQVMPAAWNNSNTNAGTLNSVTGAFQARANVSADTVATITGSYTAFGITVTDSLNITVVDATVYPVSAQVIGPNTINEEATATYTLRVTFDDGSIADVAVTDWASSNSAAGTIAATSGVFTAAVNDTGSNITTVLTATHAVDGVSVTGTKTIGIVDTDAYPVSAVIVGPVTVNENATAQYELEVTYTNDTTQIVSATWTSNNAQAGAISASSGLFTALENIVGNKAVTISATYSEGDITVGDTLDAQVLDTIIRPTSAQIIGLLNVNEDITATYQLEVTYDTGTKEVKAVNTWASSNTQAGAINLSTGVFTPANILADVATTISAAYTEHGVTVTADELVTVRYVREPVAATVLGNSTVAEGSTATYQLQVTFDDGSTEVVGVSDWAVTPTVGTINASSGLLSAVANVTTNTAAEVTASYTEADITVEGTLSITVQNTRNLPVSATIVAPASIDEGDSSTFIFRVTYENGTSANVAINNWAVADSAAGTLNASTGAFVAAQQTADVVTEISGSYTEHGVTVDATKPLTVVDTTNYPISAAISGVSSVMEGATANYNLEVTYTDGATLAATASDWASSNTDVAIIDPSTGAMTALSVEENTLVTLSCSYTAHGRTVTDTFNVTILNQVELPVENAGMPRWGYATFSGETLDEYEHNGPQSFIDTNLTTIMPSTDDGETLTYSLPDEITFAYYAHPKSLGVATFVDLGNGFAGAWDGATWKEDLSNMDAMGPITVMYDDGTGPAEWYVYRTDWQGPSYQPTTFQISYADN